ncbi:bifunctional biotin--[acetyl-CoA-carboxylase] ligase/biotin operon repressor BirA [[Pasteurella] aerogenes]
MTSDLLSYLSDGKAHSRQKLTALFALDADTLQREIQQFLDQGLPIIETPQEIQLQPQLPLLDQARLQAQLAPYRLILQPVIHSTNQYLLDNIAQCQQGDLCLAEYQLAGRGRRGRQWQSPFAGQIILSQYWTLPAQISLHGLSLVVGITIAETLIAENIPNIRLKWPNDILLNGKKLAGILIEIAPKRCELLELIIGIGINISIPSTNFIDQAWADLSAPLPQVSREAIIVRLVSNLTQNLTLFEQHGMAFFRQRWLALDHFLGQPVNIITAKETLSGISQGIDEQGFLLIKNAQDQDLRFNAGEVSLRKGMID